MERTALQVSALLLKSCKGAEFQARSHELGHIGNLCKWELNPDCCLQEAHSLGTPSEQHAAQLQSRDWTRGLEELVMLKVRVPWHLPQKFVYWRANRHLHCSHLQGELCLGTFAFTGGVTRSPQGRTLGSWQFAETISSATARADGAAGGCRVLVASTCFSLFAQGFLLEFQLCLPKPWWLVK